MKTKPRRRLAHRLYAIGLLQLFVVVLAAAAIFVVVAHTATSIEASDIKGRLSPLVDDRTALERELRAMQDEDRVDVSIYDAAQRVLASNVDPPLRLPPFRVADLADGGMPRPLSGEAPTHFPPKPDEGERWPPPPPLMFVELDGRSETLLAVARLPRRPSAWLPILTLMSGVVVVSVGAVLTARFLTTPLGRMSTAVKAFGDGNLSARARLQRDDELGALGDAFDEMAERIQTLLQVEKELLANVAHELRTPLSRIRVALEIATEGDAETARAFLPEIGADLAELETLLADVLTTARLDLANGSAGAARFMMHRETLSPTWLVERAAERFRSRFPSRPLAVSIQGDLPNVDADPVLFRRVLDNLLENSHKYSPDPLAEITIGATATDNGIVFDVRDFGTGIPQDDLPRLFQAFYRGEKSRSRRTGGVGLGLSLAQRVVEAHDGTIEVASSLGVGTTVRVFLPMLVQSRAASS